MSVSSIQAVAFDMDGLMFNTEDVYFQVGSRLMRRRGYEYTDELRAAIMGTPPQKSFETMIAWYDLPDTWEAMHQESDDIFFELLDESLAPMPGLMSLLDYLEAHNIPKAICTSSSRRVLEGVLKRFQLEPRFRFTITANEITRGKPNPDIYLMAAEHFGVLPQNMLVLEDSEAGCRAGASAGAFIVAVPGEHSRNMDFSSAKMILESLADPRLYEVLPETSVNGL
ncbi:MAG: HAD family phosphatase [Planctomycetia bacterium]|nr:HAD family phosphatase [Planctomycetia bacterium]